MKLRFLLVSALALAFSVPVALANESTDEVPPSDETPTKVDEGAHEDGEKKHDAKNDQAKKGKHYHKVKKHGMRRLCRPRVGVIVRGELVSVDADAGVFTMLVDKANRHGKRFVGDEATFKLAKKGKVRKHGRATLAGVEAALEAKSGYRVKVMGWAQPAGQRSGTSTRPRISTRST